MNNLLLIALLFLTCSSKKIQSKTNRIQSHKNLSTFFFDDQTKISILSKSFTYFFLNLAIPEKLHYSVIQTQNSDKIIKKNGYFQDENSMISVNNTNYLIAYFIMDKNSIRKHHKRISSNRVSSISFISIDSGNLCQHGIEFIQSEMDYKLKEDKRKCFYIPPKYKNSALLITNNKTYKSSIIENVEIKNTKSNNKLSTNEQSINNPNLLSFHDSEKIKNKKTLESKNNNYPCQYRKKYMKQKKSFFSIIIPNSFLVAIIVSTIFLISLCASKRAVYADPNNNCTTTPIKEGKKTRNTNANYNANSYYNPQPTPVPAHNPMLPMNQIRPATAVNSYMNPYAGLNTFTTNTTINNGTSCTYQDNVPLGEIIPPSNANIINPPNSYPGVVPYGGAMPTPKPNTMQSSINQVNAYFQPY